MTNPTLETVSLKAFFGWVAIDSRMRLEGNKLIGEGRSIYYDRHGNIEKDTGWQPTGVELHW